jgi:hypothetical protein
MSTITDSTVNPIVIPDAGTTDPLTSIAVDDTLGTPENIGVSLSFDPSLGYYYGYYGPAPTSLGTLTDPAASGTFSSSTNTFTAAALVTGAPTAATQILGRLVYAPPNLPKGVSLPITATVNVNGSITSDTFEIVTPPSITGAVASQPVAYGSSIFPFGEVNVLDGNYYYTSSLSETITISNGGSPTDADGLLTGPGLSKTGVGTYTLTGFAAENLENLTFTPTAVAAGQSRLTNFTLTATDIPTKLSTTDSTTSVLTVGPPGGGPPVPPLISGTASGQTVAPGNSISPFKTVTISDPNLSPTDSATITLTGGGGTLSGDGLTMTAAGVYTLAATSPATLTAELNALTFVAPPLRQQASVTTGFALGIADGTQTASDSKTSVIEAAPPLQTGQSGSTGADNFTISDETTGLQTAAVGSPYTGPITGISDDIILVSADNLNITANIANVFIHSGSGNDALNVSAANGNNILDGSTGSNFLVGGTGTDTFFVDDRGPTADIWDTVANFHAGDAATIWGVTPADFNLAWVDGQGAAGYTGLTLHATAAGKPTASLTLAGFTSTDLNDGRLSVSYGTDPASGSAYMYVHDNS